MSPSRPNGVVNFFVVNAYRVVSEFVVISGKLFREHWSTFSLTFTSDSALNEIVYIQSLRTGKKDPQYIASTIPSVLDPKATMKSLHKERLLLFFFNERKQYLLAQETQKAKDAIALYQKLGLLKDDNSSHSSSVLDTGEPIVNTETVPKASQQGESTMQNKPKSSFRDFLNKYRK